MADRDVRLADVIITPRLWVGPPRASSFEAEMLVMRRLAATLSQSPPAIFEACADAALGLCRADTAGIRLSETAPDGSRVFRWIAVAGQLKGILLDMTAPREFSPCGICVDTSGPLLLERPERVFDDLDVGVPFHRALLVPLAERGSGLEGTIWVISHNDVHEFDSEDARMLQRIAVFTATAVHMARVADEARSTAAAHQLAFDELDHRVKNTFQMTAGILDLHLRSIKDPIARAALTSARERILAMGKLHDIASHGEEDDLSELVRSICDELATSNPDCAIEVHTEGIVSLPAHKAALAGLIVNELVHNCLKHAFPNASGSVKVDLRLVEEGRATLAVSDNGVPLSDSFANEQENGRGLGIVRALAQQLGGTLDVDVTAKRFAITFQAGSRAA